MTANSPLVIMWPNEDGTFTLSQRKAPRHVMPSGKLNWSTGLTHSRPQPPKDSAVERGIDVVQHNKHESEL